MEKQLFQANYMTTWGSPIDSGLRTYGSFIRYIRIALLHTTISISDVRAVFVWIVPAPIPCQILG